MTKPAFQYIARGDVSESNDCTVRALSTAAQLPYYEAHAAMAAAGRAKGRAVPFYPVDAAYTAKGGSWTNIQDRKMTLAQFTRSLPAKHRYAVLINRHVFAMIDGVQHDLSKNGARCRVIGYWKFD